MTSGTAARFRETADPDIESRPALHVVFFASWLRFPHGMAETIRARLIGRALVEAGVSVHVLCLQAGERPPVVENTETRGCYKGVTFEYAAGTTRRQDSFVVRRLVEARGWLCGVRRLLQLRRQGKLDCVYLWSTWEHWSWLKLAYLQMLRALRVPVVAELNEWPGLFVKQRPRFRAPRSDMRDAAGAVVISSFLREWAVAEGLRLNRSLELIQVPILVDVDEREPSEYPTGEPMVLFAGSPLYDENIRFVFRAMEAVWREFPTCRLVVTGANPADPAARWLLEQARGYVEGVEIAGYVSRTDLLKKYAAAHALLIPLPDDVRSRARFPTKIGEYLAASRPIVTTSVGEVRRYFTDGENAFVCEPGDEEAYGAKICEALREPLRAAAIGRAGRETARQFFDYALYGETLREGFLRVRARRS